MTTSQSTAVTQPHSTPGSGPVTGAYTGFRHMMRFILRRNWLRILIWVLVLAAMIAVVVQSQRVTFPTQADRTTYVAIANTPAVAAMTGLPYAASTLGGILNIKIWMTNAIALAFAVIFLVTHNGRAEEESGRTEVLRGGVLGQHAYSLANWVVAAGLSVAVGAATTLVAISQQLPVGGALVMGASYAGVGLVFTSVAAVAGQLALTSRGANTLAAIVLAAAYLIRAVADLQATGDTPSWLTWLSPLGWGQQMRSFGENLWWPLGISVAVATALTLTALALEHTRDLGQGLLPDRPGPRTASPWTCTPVGLTARLHRGPIIGWSVGVLVGALFFGTVATSMVDLLGGNEAASQVFLGNTDNLLDSLLEFLTMANVLLIAAFAIQLTVAVRLEEQSGLAELQWSRAISRVRWACSRMLVPAVWSLVLLVASGLAIGSSFELSVGKSGQVLKFVAGSLTYWPSILLMIGSVMFCAAWLPRAAIAVTWALFGVLVVLSMFGDLFGLPAWVTDNTPFMAIPKVGASFNFLPVAIILTLAAGLILLGLWRLRRRDMTSE